MSAIAISTGSAPAGPAMSTVKRKLGVAVPGVALPERARLVARRKAERREADRRPTAGASPTQNGWRVVPVAGGCQVAAFICGERVGETAREAAADDERRAGRTAEDADRA